jgi:hypothetical protein
MRTPKISTKRALGLTLATALAVTATVAVAANSQAVTTPSATLSPATGSAAGGTVATVKGKGFADSTGAAVAKAVKFSSSACTTTVATGTAATNFNVVSATKIDVVTPALAAGTWYACVFDAASGTGTILGQAKFVTGAAPTATTITPATTNVAKASTKGGTVIAVTGSAFDKTVNATIDGVTAKATLVSATKVSVTLPAHAAGTLLKVKVSTQFGSASTSDTVSYVPVVTVSPATGDGTAGNVVTLTGSGFSAMDFSGSGTYNVVFEPGGAAPTTSSTVASLNPCTSVVVESDTTLTCQAPALTGAYSAAIITSASSNWATAVSQVSKSATYTAAAF